VAARPILPAWRNDLLHRSPNQRRCHFGASTAQLTKPSGLGRSRRPTNAQLSRRRLNSQRISDEANGDAAAMTEQRLSAEQQRALKILAKAGQNGATEATLLAHGFWREMLAELVLAGLATVVTETIGPAIKVERYRITHDGRKALEG